MKKKPLIILIISIAAILVATAIVSVIIITNRSKEPGEETDDQKGEAQQITGCGVVSDDGKFVFSFPKYSYDKQLIITNYRK